jgi:hypothetical protein
MDYPLTVVGIDLFGGKFTDGNPLAGIPASGDTSEWANNVTDSIKNVQTAGGVAAIENDATQLLVGMLAAARFPDTGAVNALAVAWPAGLSMAPPAVASLPNGFTIMVVPANTTTDANPTLSFAGGGPITITDALGNALQPGDLVAGQPTQLMKSGGGAPTWQLLRRAARRIVLGASLELYINASTGNDATGNGTSAAPWATLQHARDWAMQNLDLGGQFGVVYSCVGAFAAGVSCVNALAGASGTAEQFSFAATSSITATNGNCISVAGGGTNVGIVVGAGAVLSLSASGSAGGQGQGLNVFQSGTLTVSGSGSVNFGSCSGGHVVENSGGINLTCNYTISGNAPVHWSLQGPGSIVLGQTGSQVITLTGTPAFSVAFANGGGAGPAGILVSSSTVSFSGSATGSRYNITQNCTLQTNGGGASFLPGNAAGTVSSGGQYT